MSTHHIEPPDPTSKEPATTTGLVWTFIAALIGAGVAFGLPVTDAQQTAILILVAAAGPLVTALRIRPKVYAPATVAQMQERD